MTADGGFGGQGATSMIAGSSRADGGDPGGFGSGSGFGKRGGSGQSGFAIVFDVNGNPVVGFLGYGGGGGDSANSPATAFDVLRNTAAIDGQNADTGSGGGGSGGVSLINLTDVNGGVGGSGEVIVYEYILDAAA
jgi:hypothetical protein